MPWVPTMDALTSFAVGAGQKLRNGHPLLLLFRNPKWWTIHQDLSRRRCCCGDRPDGRVLLDELLLDLFKNLSLIEPFASTGILLSLVLNLAISSPVSSSAPSELTHSSSEERLDSSG